MHTIARWITQAIDHRNDPQVLRSIRGQVLELADTFPLYGWLRVPETVAAEYGP
jgi:glycine hydroxymethyltransferase